VRGIYTTDHFLIGYKYYDLLSSGKKDNYGKRFYYISDNCDITSSFVTATIRSVDGKAYGNLIHW